MIKPHKKPCNCDVCEKARYWQPCMGCKDGHFSFWATITRSPEWKLWEEEISRRINKHNKKKSRIYTGVWDIDECQECGWISKEHWADFVKFIKKRNDSGQK